MLSIPEWPLIKMTGYKPKTTFWEDFSIADVFGVKEVEDTFNRVFKEWKDDTVYGTELAMVINWKQFQFAEDGIAKSEMCKLYCKLWEKIDSYICNNWGDEKLTFYYRETD